MDVGAWLRELGLDQYEAAFHENAVDAAVLPRLTTDDLKEMGVIPIPAYQPISPLRVDGPAGEAGGACGSAA